MYENFTDRARKVMQLANQEAQRFNHEYIDTGHVLLGLIAEGSGVAANVLKNLDVDLRKIRLEVEKLIQSGPDMVTLGKLPQTPRANEVIEYSMEEARGLSHNYVGTEHILLGLLRGQEGVAAQVLMNLGLKLEEVREEVLHVLGQGSGSGTTTPFDPWWQFRAPVFGMRAGTIVPPVMLLGVGLSVLVGVSTVAGAMIIGAGIGFAIGRLRFAST